MTEKRLSLIAEKYISVIEQIEKEADLTELLRLEELRIQWHNRFLNCLRREGVRVVDRFHATKIAYDILKWKRLR